MRGMFRTVFAMLAVAGCMAAGPTAALARFMQEGRSAVHRQELGLQIRQRFLGLAEVLAPPEDAVTGRLRARMALMTLNLGALPGRLMLANSPPTHMTVQRPRSIVADAVAKEMLSSIVFTTDDWPLRGGLADRHQSALRHPRLWAPAG